MKNKYQLAIILIIMSAGVFFAPTQAHAASYYVAPNGNDSNSGTSKQPFRSIQKAVDTARSGDTVTVNPGVYNEQITLRNSGVTIRGSNPNSRPQVSGGNGQRRYGFHAPSGFSNITMENFEIYGQGDIGIYIEPSSNQSYKIKNNLVHHILNYGMQVRGNNHLIEGNIIYMITGQDSTDEASGILLRQASGGVISNNQIFLVRKQCIRAASSNNVLIQSNIVHACGNGIVLNSPHGGNRVFNNYAFKNFSTGFKSKHSDTTRDSAWNVIWHNTAYDNYLENLAFGENLPPTDYLDIRNNIFVGGLSKHVENANPQNVLSNFILDGNVYYKSGQQPAYLYSESFGNSGVNSIAQIRSTTGYENNGREFNPLLLSPENGQLDYSASSPAAQGGPDLSSITGRYPSPYRNQLGARGLTPAIPLFKKIPMSVHRASSNQGAAAKTVDGTAFGNWVGNSRNESITYDLGSTKQFRYIVWRPDTNNHVNIFSFSISNDDSSYSQVVSGSSNDNLGNPLIHELPQPVSARYLRFNMLDSQDARAGLDEIWIGNLNGKIGTPVSGGIGCHILDSTKPLYNGYAASYNVFSSGKELLLTADCSSSQPKITIGSDNPNILVYNKGYKTSGTSWTPLTLTCEGQSISDSNGITWCRGMATASLTQSDAWFVAYTCQQISGLWKCGCRDSACSTTANPPSGGLWQLQGIKK
jgi:parallel beta-helix repeat protein